MSQLELLDSQEYFYEFFPQTYNQSSFAQMKDLTVCLGFNLNGPGGRDWTLSFVEGQLREVIPRMTAQVELCYSLDTSTFFKIVSGQLKPQEAFFRGEIKLTGDTLKALKMANILTEFFSAYPYKSPIEMDRKFEEAKLPVIEEKVYYELEKGRDRIEGVLAYKEEIRAASRILIVPPHPYLGGNMDNNVVLFLAQALALSGFVTLRFNYRGVGNNQSAIPPDQKELEVFWKESLSPSDNEKLADVFAGISYLAQVISSAQPDTSVLASEEANEIVLVGYSFGAYLAALASKESSSVQALVLVAPPVDFHNFELLKTSRIPTLIIGSDNDFVNPPESLQRLYDSLQGTKKLYFLSGKDHFFIGQEKEMTSLVSDFLAEICLPSRCYQT
jgi:hypothetical protein